MPLINLIVCSYCNIYFIDNKLLNIEISMNKFNMRCWITGGGGFMGPHLADYLVGHGHEVLSTYYPSGERLKRINTKVIYEECDVRQKDVVFSRLKEFRPEKIFHLAAQSYPTVSWQDPWYTLETNLLGTTNVFEGVKNLGLNCKIMNACSSAEYGFVNADEVPIKETHPLKPLHPYGVTKVAQEMLAYQYFKNFGIPVVSLRIFNTTGPGKANDVCSDFAKGIVEIEKRINPDNRLSVGNLETRRAITDVRDVIRAFDLCLERATIGETYNVSGKDVYQMKDIINLLRGLTDVSFETVPNPALMRPTDEPIIYGDSSKFEKETGWKPEIPLETSLKDMLEYYRENL